MKKILFIAILFASFAASAQTLTVIRRATSQITTIPASDTIQGKLYTDSAYNTNCTYLKYIGTTNLANVFVGSSIGKYGWMYVYIPSDSVLAKVITCVAIGDATIDTFRLQVDRAVPAIVNKAFKTIKAKDYGYSFQNDGSANGYANGVVIKTNEAVTMTMQAIEGTSQTPWQEPVIINATATDFLIVERKAP